MWRRAFHEKTSYNFASETCTDLVTFNILHQSNIVIGCGFFTCKLHNDKVTSRQILFTIIFITLEIWTLLISGITKWDWKVTLFWATGERFLFGFGLFWPFQAPLLISTHFLLFSPFLFSAVRLLQAIFCLAIGGGVYFWVTVHVVFFLVVFFSLSFFFFACSAFLPSFSLWAFSNYIFSGVSVMILVFTFIFTILFFLSVAFGKGRMTSGDT